MAQHNGSKGLSRRNSALEKFHFQINVAVFAGIKAIDSIIPVFIGGKTKKNVGIFGIDAFQIGNCLGQNFFVHIIRLPGKMTDDAPFNVFLEKNISMLRQGIRQNFTHRIGHGIRIGNARHSAGGSIQKAIGLFMPHKLFVKFAPILRFASTRPRTNSFVAIFVDVRALLKCTVFGTIFGEVSRFVALETRKRCHDDVVKDRL